MTKTDLDKLEMEFHAQGWISTEKWKILQSAGRGDETLAGDAVVEAAKKRREELRREAEAQQRKRYAEMMANPQEWLKREVQKALHAPIGITSQRRHGERYWDPGTGHVGLFPCEVFALAHAIDVFPGVLLKALASSFSPGNIALISAVRDGTHPYRRIEAQWGDKYAHCHSTEIVGRASARLWFFEDPSEANVRSITFRLDD